MKTQVILIRNASGKLEQMKTSKHRHRVESDRDMSYRGPVSERENPAAHGNITRKETCKCGAVRYKNINWPYVERGPWMEVDDEV